jgi:hypothetical protein
MNLEVSIRYCPACGRSTSAGSCSGESDDRYAALRVQLDEAEANGAQVDRRGLPEQPADQPHEPTPTIRRPLGYWQERSG